MPPSAVKLSIRGSTGFSLWAFQAMHGALFSILLMPMGYGQAAKHTNYEDDVRPIFSRRCFACHSAAEMRAGLNLESYAGVLKGGGSGEILKPGRPGASILYQAVAHEGNGVPQMPLGLPKIPEAEIAVIRDWIQQGALETATSQPKGPVQQSLDFKPSNLNRPAGAPAMPASLAPVTLAEPARAHPVTALAASPWAPLLAVAGHERIYLYDLVKRASIGELAFPEGIPYVLRFSRDGATLLAAGGRGVQSGKVVLFDVRTGERRAVVGEERDIVLAADLSADGRLVALGGPGKVVKVYSVAGGKQLYEIKKHTDWITALEFSPDGSRLASADRSGGIHLWEPATGGIVVSLAEHKDAVTSLDWRSDGALLASGSEDGQIILWNAHDGFPVATMAKAHQPKPAAGTFGTPPGGVLSVQFASDGRLVSVGRDRVIRIWSSDGKPVGASTAQPALLTKVAASPDSKLFIAGDYEGKLLLWDGRQISTLSTHSAQAKLEPVR
jgi:WD40 repeat protein